MLDNKQRLAAKLPYSKHSRWIVTCNFAEFYICDMEKPFGELVASVWKLLYERFDVHIE